MDDATTAAAGRGDSAPAALAALLHFLERPTVDRLRQVLGLSSSGTVRLVDRLAESGYVERANAVDRRSTAIVLTVPAGLPPSRCAGLVPTCSTPLLRPCQRMSGRSLTGWWARCWSA